MHAAGSHKRMSFASEHIEDDVGIDEVIVPFRRDIHPLVVETAGKVFVLTIKISNVSDPSALLEQVAAA